MLVREVHCKSLLNKSGLADYCINCYTGCSHGCRYCYARFMKKYTKHSEPWGEFVDVKINAPDVLRRELYKKPKGSVFLSSVCDAYQPLEEKYRLTRKVLMELLREQWPIVVQTKSPLILRDLDLLKQFKDVEVGFTVTTLDEDVCKTFEPRVSHGEERVQALKQIHKAGIKTYAFLGPMFPILIEKELDKMIKTLAEIPVDYIWIDKLSIKYGNWPDIKKAVGENYPELLERWEQILFTKNDYYLHLKERIKRLSDNYEVEAVFCY